MGLFDSLGRGPGNQQPGADRQQMLQQIKADPQGVLRQRGYQVPDNVTDPMQLVNHLIQTGQVGGQRLQMVRKMMGR